MLMQGFNPVSDAFLDADYHELIRSCIFVEKNVASVCFFFRKKIDMGDKRNEF